MELIIYHHLFHTENKNRLTTQELFLYTQLRKRNMSNGVLETSLDILSKRVILYKKPRRNKEVIKELLVNLQKKKVIKFEEENGVIDIEFYFCEEPFIKLPSQWLDLIESPEELYLVAFIMSAKHKRRSMPFAFIGEVLNVSTNTAQNVVKGLVERGLLHKKTGEKIFNHEREANTYTLQSISHESYERPQESYVEEIESPQDTKPLKEYKPAKIDLIQKKGTKTPKDFFLEQQESIPIEKKETPKRSAAEILAEQEKPENNIVEKTKKEPRKISDSAIEKNPWLKRYQKKAEQKEIVEKREETIEPVERVF
ncbi:hypothetical protein LCY76_09485 [Fictibacillus sp. KIGAM418]|uniref:Uncharacterized protein n=1 Tax=Fictibacillus marinisediminis TaxID=2878389 RepID=A0A9X2BDM0_9BACL|nr:hypothetical protein [Fictibacillus marinisediminis]MCK6256825.1 hypothetical protein [Fictibacillus marinisediminis]